MHKILIVDDEPNVQKVLVSRLRFAGYEVDCASNGREALGAFVESLHKRPYSLIILDIMMPGMNGIEVLELIRREEEIRGILYGDGVPVIMLTALKKPYMEAFGRGCDDFLVKPYQPEELLSKIQEKISLRYSDLP